METAQSGAGAGKVEHEPGPFCCSRQQERAQKMIGTWREDKASLKGFPLAKLETV